ncbi:hypothetical protein [Methanobrevibacter sp.]
MKSDSSVDELVISYLFPPSRDVSGMVLAKRQIVENRRFDVICSDIKKDNDPEFKKLVDKYINEQILIDLACSPNFTECIFDFVEKSMEELDLRDTYKRIYSRVWKIANNFLALEYKLKHPDTYWISEFSDPLLYDIHNRKRDGGKKQVIENGEYLERINRAITDLNAAKNTDFELVENPCNVHFLVEYIAYLFADEIIFTNENQRHVMLDQFPYDVRDFVMDKSTVKLHPILSEEYYHIKDCPCTLDSSKINLGYFGNIYSKRHFETIFYAYEILNHKYKDRMQFHFYVNDPGQVKRLMEGLEIYANVEINKTIDYLDFLNLTTKLDILIVNDLITSDCFEVNPYRPSKLSDYIGSKSKIWAVCEKGSCLDDVKTDYKSYITSRKSNIDAIVDILEDFSFEDSDYSLKDDEEYFIKRVTELNILIENEHKRLKSARSQVKKLKKKNENLKKDSDEEKNVIRKILRL